MMYRNQIAIAMLIMAISFPIHSQERQESVGGDIFVSGSSPSLSTSAPRDVFVSGFSPSLSNNIAGDAHIAGFDVDVSGTIGKDLYAAGASLTISAKILEDLTASGFTIRLKDNASVGGNVRLAAGTVTLDAPVTGSVVAAGGEIKFNAAVEGDVQLTSSAISFGPSAKISGTLDYYAPQKIEIPSSVISPDRIRYSALSGHGRFSDMRDTIDESVPSFWPSLLHMITGTVLSLVFLLLVAALFLAFLPRPVSELQNSIRDHPGKSLLAGFLGLSMMIGAIPVSAITLVGIPLIPFVILALILLWTLGYLLGAYTIGMRVLGTVPSRSESVAGQIFVLAVSLIVLGAMNFIPIAGWLLNLFVVFIGIGAMTIRMITRLRLTESRIDNSRLIEHKNGDTEADGMSG